MNKLKALIVFFCVLMVAGLALVSRKTKPVAPDPMYKGKTASQWATEFAFHTTEEARDALNHLGAAATPFLVPYLDRPDSRLNSFYYKLWEMLPRIIQKKFVRPELAGNVRQNAAIAFRDIQPVSRAAIPVLIQYLNSTDVTVQLLSHYALGNLGPEATAAVSALKLCLKRDDVAERVYAAWALWQIEHNVAEVLPIFEEALDRKYGVPWLVMGFLADMGSAAEHAVPLIEAVAEEDRVQPPRVLSQALQALARISTNTVRFLIKHLKHMDPGIRVSAAVALGNIGPPAAASVGSLEALLQDQEVGMQYIRDRHLYPEPVAHAAREALDKILGKSTEDSNEK
jgi:HEAT repeat protein